MHPKAYEKKPGKYLVVSPTFLVLMGTRTEALFSLSLH